MSVVKKQAEPEDKNVLTPTPVLIPVSNQMSNIWLEVAVWAAVSHLGHWAVTVD